MLDPPRKPWPEGADEQLFAVRALGRLFELVGLPRYAAICQSETTEAVVRLWEEDPKAGFDAFRHASDSSGVEPPDTDLLTWGQVMGQEEATAYYGLSAALEEAIVGGELRPGGRGWKGVQAQIASSFLAAERPEVPGGESHHHAILTERVSTWAGSREGPRQRLLMRVGKHVLVPAAMPEGAAEALAPLAWLVDHAREGIALTQTGNLNRALCREAAERFSWWRYRLPPRGELDLPVLSEMRDIAAEIRAVRRSGRRLVITKKGAALFADHDALWRETARSILAPRDFFAAVAEPSLCVMVDAEDPPSERRVEAEITPMLAEGGWRSVDGSAPDGESVRRALRGALRRLDLLGMHTREGPWQDPLVLLTPAGRATALEALRLRAGGPRKA